MSSADVAQLPINQSSEMPTVPIFRLSVEQYHEMIRAGILTDDDRVELLEGLLVEKMSKNPPHRIATRLLTKALESVVPAGWYVEPQEPITVPGSEPEPDVAVIRGNTKDYGDRHPGAADVALVVEVADASLLQDRVTKPRIYGRAGIASYWIVNLKDRRIEVHTQPSAAGYAERKDFGPGDSVPVMLQGVEIGNVEVANIFP